MRVHVGVARVLISLSLACALPGARPEPGRATLEGQVKLVPRDGVTPAAADHPLYRSRTLRDAILVDYSRPGFAVVYAEGASDDRTPAALSIESSRFGIRMEPEHAVVGLAGSIVVRNATAQPQVVSCPELEVLERVEPGAERVLHAESAGAKRCVVLGQEKARTIVFVAPGPHAVISETGRFTLANLSPGRWHVGVWHPRFPGSAREVELAPGVVESLTLELGVGEIGENVR
jgi:hypothetical protein